MVTRETICAIGSAIEMQQPTMPIDSVTIQTISAMPPVFIGSSSAASSATAAAGFGDAPGRPIDLCRKRKIRLSGSTVHTSRIPNRKYV